MNAGTIVGYVTRPNGSPISGAKIWIAQANEFSFGEAEIKAIVKTDVRGYFQLALTVCGAVCGKLNISVGAQKGDQTNSKADITSQNRFQVTGYLIKDAAALNA